MSGSLRLFNGGNRNSSDVLDVFADALESRGNLFVDLPKFRADLRIVFLCFFTIGSFCLRAVNVGIPSSPERCGWKKQSAYEQMDSVVKETDAESL